MGSLMLLWYLFGVFGWIGFCLMGGTLTVGDLVACVFVGFTGPFLFVLIGIFYMIKWLDHLFSMVLWRKSP